MTNTTVQQYKDKVKDEFYKQLVQKIESQTGLECTYYNDKIWIYKKKRSIEIQIFAMNFMTVYCFKGEAYEGEEFSKAKHDAAEKKLQKLLLEEQVALEEKGKEMFENINKYESQIRILKTFR